MSAFFAHELQLKFSVVDGSVIGLDPKFVKNCNDRRPIDTI